MKKIIVMLVALSFLIVFLSAFKSFDIIKNDRGYLKGSLLVVFSKEATKLNDFSVKKENNRISTGIIEINQLNDYFKVKSFKKRDFDAKDKNLAEKLGFYRSYIFYFPENSDMEKIAKKYLNSKFIEIAEPDWFAHHASIPNDPLYNNQWGHHNTKQMPAWDRGTTEHTGPLVGTIDFDSKIESAWNASQGYGNSSVIIAIIDSGVDASHPDLNQVSGYDFGDGDSNPDDDGANNGHGTAVAGIAAAISNNNLGVSGAAGGCKIMPLKVDDSYGNITISAIESAIAYAANNGADIINISLYSNYSLSIANKLEYAYNQGITIFAGSGNENAPAIVFPASNKYVIAVGAAAPCGGRKRSSKYMDDVYSGTYTDPNGVSCDNEIWWGANYGPADQDSAYAIDILAPTILPTTDLQGTSGYNTASGTSGNYYLFFSGTSCASPYAAGVGALIKSLHPTWTPLQIRERIVNSATDVVNVESGIGWDKYSGYGLINAGAALGMPTCIITNPANNASLQKGSTITISATSSDWAKSVTSIDFYIDGTLKNTDTTSPYEYIWNTSTELVGSHIIKARAIDNNNNFTDKEINVILYTAMTIPFTEDFENAGMLPVGWTEEYVSGNTNWSFQSGGERSHPAAAHNGSYNAFLYNENTEETRLITPKIDFATNTDTPKLKFWHTQAEWAGGQDELKVYYKSSLTANWTLLTSYTSNIASWTQETISLPNPSSDYYVAFSGLSKYGYGICIDDVEITGNPSGTPAFSISPSSLAFGNVEVGQNSVKQFTITNSGAGGTLTGNITTPAGYSVANALKSAKGKNILSYSISSNQTFNLTFSPTSATNYNGSVLITCNEDTPSNVAVTGNGVAATLAVTPTSLSQTMVTNETASENLKLKNIGGAELNYNASILYSKGKTVATVYPSSINYCTGSTTNASKTETSLVKGYNTEDGWMKFDISSIPDGSIINSVEFHAYVNDTNYPYWSITPISNDPVIASASTLQSDITTEAASGYYLYRSEENTYTTGWKVHTLGGTVNSDLQNAISQNWFAIGIVSRDDDSSYYINFDGWNESNKPYLVIDYTPNANWLKINNTTSASGTILANNFTNLSISFNSLNLAIGSYNANISINSNDPTSPTNIPVTLTVEATSDTTSSASNNNGDGSTAAMVDVPPMTTGGEVVDPDVTMDPTGTVPVIVDVDVNDTAQHSGLTSAVVLSYNTSITGNVSGIVSSFTLSFSGLSANPSYIYWLNGSTWETPNSINWNYTGKSVSFDVTFSAKDNQTEFTLASDNPLPVELSSFTGYFNNGAAFLNWVTESETNNSHWNVYRNETENFENSKKLNDSEINGSGTSNSASSYEFQDINSIEFGKTYYYWIESIDFSGATTLYNPISIVIPQQDDNSDVPNIVQYGLQQNYPNPFNPSTKISFILKESATTSLEIYNLKGEKITTLINRKNIEKDIATSVIWNGLDKNGKNVSSGIYFYKLMAEKQTEIKQMVLLK